MNGEWIDIQRFLRDDNRLPRQAAKTFSDGMRDGDPLKIAESLKLLSLTGAWRETFTVCARLTTVAAEAKVRFAEIWHQNGEYIRDQVNDELVLIRGLRKLLPACSGSPLTLFRGESMFNRQRRSYGLLWSTRVDEAERSADGMCRTVDGGSVVLRVEAPASAIFHAPTHDGKDDEHAEYLVDRSQLRDVQVIRRFSQISIDEYRARASNSSQEMAVIPGWA
jgi:hypothetical protein